MKKIIRLTESDLNKIVKRVISEVSGKYTDNVKELMTERSIIIKNKTKDQVRQLLNSLPNGLILLNIINCEYADFSGIDVCGFPELEFVNLTGTDNNFYEHAVNCFNGDDKSLYLRFSDEEKIQSMKGPTYRGFRQIKK